MNHKPLQDLDVPDVNILLIGQVKAGKSSFFNMINSIFRGEITARACAGNSNHSLTTTFRKYRIRNPSSGTYLHFRLCDTRGLEEQMSIHLQDIEMILDDFLLDQYKFNPAAPANAQSLGVKKAAALKDRIHCVAFVVDGSSICVMSESIQEKTKLLQQLLLEKGIPQLVYLTKLDLLCPMVDEDIRGLFYCGDCKMALDTAAHVIGLPRSHVFPIKNYEKETNLSIQVNILALKALRQTLVFADDYLEDQYEMSHVD